MQINDCVNIHENNYPIFGKYILYQNPHNAQAHLLYTLTFTSTHECLAETKIKLLVIPYSWKYWRGLNLAVELKIANARILADLNLAVRYGIAIHTYIIYVSRKLWWILIRRLWYRLPNHHIFRLYSK